MLEFINIEYLLTAFTLMLLCFVQNISFTMTSRSRNRDHKLYHCICSVFSNGLFLLTLGILVKTDVSPEYFIPYIFGTVCGSLVGAEISMKIEKIIGANT